MSGKPYGVGIVGLQPGASWGAVAHVPALRTLSEDFEIIGVANTSRASAEAAAAACGIPRAFEGVAELVASSEIDVVAVTVKVPHHFEIVKAAIDAGKHVYCEWPLGNGLAEAHELADLARAKGVLSVIGTQARVAPEIEYLRELIANGFVGEVLSTTVIGCGVTWSAEVEQRNAYLLDRTNGATLLTIPLGHTLAAVQDVLGEVAELSAQLATRRNSARVIETGKIRPMTAPDQVLIAGVLASGAPISVHYRGGMPRGTGFLWEINGTEGDIQVSATHGNSQLLPLTLRGGRGDDRELHPIDVPRSYTSDWPEDSVSGNVARVYARMAADLRNGTRMAPSFDDAVGLHRLIAAVEAAADSGCRVSPHGL